MHNKKYFSILPFTVVLILLFSSFLYARKAPQNTSDIPVGEMVSQVKDIAYNGGDSYQYDISYTGGLKIGEAQIKITKLENDQLEIYTRVTTENGMFSKVYPVDDVYVTTVQGADRLPVRMESWQKEGKSYESHKLTVYDQDNGIFTYTNNDNEPKIFEVGLPTHNEFSAFLASRVMEFTTGKPFIVATWADERRVEVVVEVMKKKKMKRTALGTVETIEIMPILTFEGLYDKKGDTVVWYSNDECRVPVKINSKIVLGSLTAKLVKYQNPNCELYPDIE